MNNTFCNLYTDGSRFCPRWGCYIDCQMLFATVSHPMAPLLKIFRCAYTVMMCERPSNILWTSSGIVGRRSLRIKYSPIYFTQFDITIAAGGGQAMQQNRFLGRLSVLKHTPNAVVCDWILRSSPSWIGFDAFVQSAAFPYTCSR
jgi:hypothetical protein